MLQTTLAAVKLTNGKANSLVRNLVVFLHISLFSSAAFGNLELTSPDVSEIPLNSTSVLLGWEHSGDQPYADTWVQTGTAAAGPDSYDVYNSGSLGELDPGQSDSVFVNGVPLNGEPLFVRLWFRELNGPWQVTDYALPTDTNLPQVPEITDVLDDQEVPYIVQWDANNTPISNWWVYAGSQPGSANYLNSGVLPGNVNFYVDDGFLFPSLPFPVITHTTLWYLETGSSWSSVSDMANLGGYITSEAILRSVNGDPTPGSGYIVNGQDPQLVLLDNNLMSDIAEVWVYMGPTAQGNDNAYYDSGSLTPDANGVVMLDTSTDLPEDGSEFYLTVWYKVDSALGLPDVWYRQAHQYISDSIEIAN